MGHWYRDTPKQFTLSCFSASSLSHADLLHCKGGVDVLSIPMIYTPFLSFLCNSYHNMQLYDATYWNNKNSHLLQYSLYILSCKSLMQHLHSQQ
jgi:hypothetical protein